MAGGCIDWSKVPPTAEYIQNEWRCAEERAFIARLAVLGAQVWGAFAGGFGGGVASIKVSGLTDSDSAYKAIAVAGGGLLVGAAVAAVSITAISYGIVKAVGHCRNARNYTPVTTGADDSP